MSGPGGREGVAALPLQLRHSGYGVAREREGDGGLSKRILVVDDDPDIRQVLLDRMSAYGYTVETAINGREALDALKRGGFDGVLLDMRMPEIDGLEVLRRTHDSHPDLPVVMVTAMSVKEQIVQAAAEGACAYLLKPFDATQLKHTVEQCFGPASEVR